MRPLPETLPALPAQPSKGWVLIVDDEPAVARSIERVLKAAGFETELAFDGTSAVKHLEQRSYDVILSDVHMPRMTGLELLRSVRAVDLDVPVILITGAPSMETAIEAVALGALHYLIKPTPNPELIEAVERAARLRRLARVKREALRLRGVGEEPGDRAGLEGAFARALRTLRVDFQPVIDSAQRSVFGYEALMRSDEPSLPHPEAVLGAAERLGRLQELSARVRHLAVEAFARAPSGATLFLNLHPRDLLDVTLFDDSPLRKMAERVVLEITERATLDDIKDVHSRISVLRYHGFRIAIDDFGAGYAGLSSFAALEPDIVKLDMGLVRDVHRSPVKSRLVESMTTLCRDLGVRLIAEGIEADDERKSLRGLGCELFQGYWFGRPVAGFPALRSEGW